MIIRREKSMNREGYRDPTAEKAVWNVSQKEVTYGQLIRHCRKKPLGYDCENCRYCNECSAFLREVGSLPISNDPEDLSEEFMATAIQVKRRGKK